MPADPACVNAILGARQKGDWQLIVLTDTIQTWGYSATVHYSHAARSVVAQSALALHTEFNANVGPNPLYRSYGLLRTAVIGGTKVTVNGPPLVAAGLTELHVELITDNGGSVAVVNQFDTTGSFTGPPEEPISVRRVSFHRPSNGTTAYAHTAKVYAGGRDISEGEAVATARAALTVARSRRSQSDHEGDDRRRARGARAATRSRDERIGRRTHACLGIAARFVHVTSEFGARLSVPSN